MSGIKFYYALLMQTLLIGSVYIIYFQSTVIDGLEAVHQEPLEEPVPAKRLVIFVLDGLSAKEFFENRCQNVPHLRQIFLNQGLVGIIRNRQNSNESRDSYMSIFSGFYQEALMWPLNPVPFDTIFNHTAQSYGWSSQNLDSFPHINQTTIVKIKEPLEAKKHSYELDEAVFQSLNEFLSKTSQLIKNFNALIYLVHLMGLEQAKDRKSFRENLFYTEHEIWKIYQRFEETFPDQSTAYLLASDAGAGAGAGCHERGNNEEMETPIFLWGSGIAHYKYLPGRNFMAKDQKLPLHIFDYIQLTPLISALLGMPPPVNNRGILSKGLLNTTSRYEAYAMRMNSLQLLAQAKHLIAYHTRGLLSDILPGFWLTKNMMDTFVSTGRLLSIQHRFNTLLEHSANFMPVILKCIDYYQFYYQRIMIIATICAILGWLYHLQSQLGSQSTKIHPRSLTICFLTFKGFILMLSFLMLAFVLVQRVPWLVLYVLILPTFMWIFALRAHEKRTKLHASYGKIFWPIVLALCSVVGFNQRQFFGLIYFGFAIYDKRKIFRLCDSEFYLWLLLIIGLTGITWLPSSLCCIHHKQNLVLASIPLTFLRPIAFGISHQRITWLCNGLVLMAAFIYILLRPSYAWIMNMISWTYLCYIFIRRPRNNNELIFNLSTLYTLLCNSYESLVIQLLATELNLGLRLKLKNEVKIPGRSSAIHIMIYSCYTFFVLGNISDIEYVLQSLDYTCFGNQSFARTIVIGIKLMLPVFLMICVFDSICKEHGTEDRRNVWFHWLLFMCNTMAMVFLIRNRNESSWQELNLNIRNFLIIQLWPLILLLIRSLAQFMLNLRYEPELPKYAKVNCL